MHEASSSAEAQAAHEPAMVAMLTHGRCYSCPHPYQHCYDQEFDQLLYCALRLLFCSCTWRKHEYILMAYLLLSCMDSKIAWSFVLQAVYIASMPTQQ